LFTKLVANHATNHTPNVVLHYDKPLTNDKIL